MKTILEIKKKLADEGIDIQGIFDIFHYLEFLNFRERESCVFYILLQELGYTLFTTYFNKLTQKERELAFKNAIKNNMGHRILMFASVLTLTEKQRKICIYNAIANGKSKNILTHCHSELTKKERSLLLNHFNK